MPVYDCRKEGRDPRALYFPCNVRVLDPATGARIPNVFYLSTSPARVARFAVDQNGDPLVDPKTRRKVRRTDPRTGRPRIDYTWDRLEIWEYRPWVAVAVDGGRVVAKSEGCP